MRQRGSVAAGQVPARSNRDRAFQLPSSALASCRFLCTQLPLEPRFRQVPLPENGPRRDAEHFSRLVESQPTEKAQLDDLALAWVDDSQTLESFIQSQNLACPVARDGGCFIQSNNQSTHAASLRVIPRAGEVHENPPHQRRSHTEEVRAILPPHVF